MRFYGLRLLIHPIWRRLPQVRRRAVLWWLSTFMAPRPPAIARVQPPIIIAGVLRTPNGLGESARLCLQALEAKGRKPLGVDLGPALLQPSLIDLDIRDGTSHKGPGVLILHVNGPLIPLACLSLGRSFMAFKRVIAFWAWELPQLPAEWRIAEPFIHEIWVPSRFTAKAVAAVTSHQLRIVPHPLEMVAPAGDGERVWRRPPNCQFAVLTMFDMASSFARKNPMGTIAAFRRAFGSDNRCRLVIKVGNANAYPPGRKQLLDAVAGENNIHLINHPLTRSQVTALYVECDAVLSLHRAEGFGLVAAEGMRQGRPVIATGWSGNMDFMTSHNSCPVSYHLVPASDPQFTYHSPEAVWAEANIDAAARYLVRLRDHPEHARLLGLRAKADTAKLFSYKRYPDPLRISDIDQP